MRVAQRTRETEFSEPVTAPLRILVVDDDPIQRAMASYYLEKHGALIQEAGDGAQGLEILATQQFDIMLTDFDMPNLNGLELLEKLREDNRHAQMMVALITSRTDISEFRVRNRGGEFVRRKPVNWHSLADELGRTYREREKDL
jgi:two-component system chemotaxis response regulator CheY